MRKLLIVEDNALISELLTQLFEDNFEIFTAKNGEEGVREAKGCLPDIVLMDLSMPVMDGWTAIKALRAEWSTCRIPIIALSANQTRAHIERALSAGADAHVAKPIEEAELFEQVDRLTGAWGEKTKPSGVRPTRNEVGQLLRDSEDDASSK